MKLRKIFKSSLSILAGAAAATAFALSSCTPKPAAKAGTQMKTAEYLGQGKTVFDNSCGKCHDLPAPQDHTPQDWVGIMNAMAPKAKLTQAQHEMVYDYIVSAQK